jgi:hypothetical protein
LQLNVDVAMATEAESPTPEVSPVPLPDVTPVETADEEKFDCPPPWWLSLVTMGFSAMTTMTVAGSLFFVLAAPEKVSPHCRNFNIEDDGLELTQGLCVFSVCCFWTYPSVCCLFVVLLFAKNLVDQRVYYEFLLHKVLIGFDRADPFSYPTVIVLLLYALCAFSALIWLHLSNPEAVLNSVYSSLAYISPIISFLAVVISSWSIQGKLITLPNFLEDYSWGLEHLNKSHSYHIENVHAGYSRAEEAFDRANAEQLTTPQMIAYVEYFTKEVVREAEAAKKAAEAAQKIADEEAAAADKAADVEVAKEGATEDLSARLKGKLGSVGQVGKGFAGKVIPGSTKDLQKEVVYWQVRLLFNPRLQDPRSQDFRNWALGYFVSVVLAILLAVYVFACLLITCLEIERILVPGTETWEWTHTFSLRPDIDHGEEGLKSLKQVAAKAVVNVMKDGAGKAFKQGILSQFQLGVAA